MMKNILLAILVLTSLAIPATAQRETAEASWDEGKISIDYGSPAWREDFADAMKQMEVWRLGTNDPTGLKLSCGLQTDDGAIPAGAYKMAMQKADGDQWELVVYSGNGHFQKGRKCWRIKPAVAKDDARATEKLVLKLNEKTLAVHFGPNAVIYPFKPVKMHDPVETRFAFYPVKINVMAVPVSEAGFDKTHVGTANVDVRSRGGGSTRIEYALHLTMNEQGASLAFVNRRAARIANERTEVESMIKRVKGMLDGADEDRQKRIKAFLEQQEKQLQEISTAEDAFKAFHQKKSLKGEVTERDAPAASLDFSHERPQGGIILTFGAGGKNASFDINPQEFRIRRR